MGRPRGFSREQVLEKAMPVFWKHGFADTSVQELERATGVNKSGLYTEFRDKEDLFVACLRHYLESQGKRGLLTKKPLGWKNVETFLKNGPLNKGEQQGCFSVNSMREFAILPDEAYGVVTENRSLLQRLLAMNIEAERPKMAPSAIAEMVLSFFEFLEGKLDAAGFFRPVSKRPVMQRNLRNMFHRMQLTQQDVRTWWGMVVRLVEGPRVNVQTRKRRKQPKKPSSEEQGG